MSTLAALPLHTPVTDAQGRMTKPWMSALQRLSQGGISAGGSEIVLSVPGTLGIRSNAAPLVTLATAETVTSIAAMVKTAPSGAGLTLAVSAAGTSIGTVTIADGAVMASVSLSAAVAADTLITLDITQVGSTFPGADLTVLVRF